MKHPIRVATLGLCVAIGAVPGTADAFAPQALARVRRGETDLRGADLSNAVLSGLDLSNRNLDTANLTGAQLGDADLRGASLRGARLSGAVFVHTLLSHADLTNAVVGPQRTEFRSCWMDFARLRGADLTNAVFDDSILHHADFANARLAHAVFADAVVDHATFASADLTDAALVRSDLSSADFRGVSLRSVDLEHSNATSAVFVNADLRLANLFGTDVRSADLTGATLDGIRDGDLRCDHNTRFPASYQNRQCDDGGIARPTISVQLHASSAVSPALLSERTQLMEALVSGCYGRHETYEPGPRGQLDARVRFGAARPDSSRRGWTWQLQSRSTAVSSGLNQCIVRAFEDSPSLGGAPGLEIAVQIAFRSR